MNDSINKFQLLTIKTFRKRQHRRLLVVSETNTCKVNEIPMGSSLSDDQPKYECEIQATNTAGSRAFIKL